MIIVAGLSPAWQQILEVNSLQTGEVNRCQSAKWCASGKVVNVGIALKHLGSASETLFPAGGYVKSLIASDLKQLNVPFRDLPQQNSTRICTTILDLSTHQTTELVENATSLSKEEVDTFSTEYMRRTSSAKVVVLTGSLPAGTPATLYQDLIAKTNCPVILDARGAELEAALKQAPFLVKPNHEELERTLSRSIPNTEELIKGMQELNQRGATWVVISQGKAALWATSADQVFRFTPPLAEVVNPIGCGDCLAAGIACGIEKGWSVPEAIRWGMGAAAENLTQLLPARLSATNVQSFFEQVKLEQIV
ncbi:MAG: 1-phosphofructokinase family hexose kinase [Planctomycetes bacterium]|nr:1-phosphofructokinase family hexose kinase [Planctomycetota bacterium]MCH9724739.1 1-phosphofructokinase family hexose kinase [Planctomycetota bacterium]MCH9778815.1 1-phosphofructokinase family hexose kinase [Planctomycetota bacterium]MCH9790405.1 1-phosphofructokinase family hexose kinase [Planctomycetota bacterium]